MNHMENKSSTDERVNIEATSIDEYGYAHSALNTGLREKKLRIIS